MKKFKNVVDNVFKRVYIKLARTNKPLIKLGGLKMKTDVTITTTIALIQHGTDSIVDIAKEFVYFLEDKGLSVIMHEYNSINSNNHNIDIVAKESRTATYYPSRDYYEDDEYDLGDYLTEDDFESLADEFIGAFNVSEDIEFLVINQFWEEA